MDPRWAHSPSNIKLRWSWGWAYDGRPDVEGIDTNNGESMYPKEKKKKKEIRLFGKFVIPHIGNWRCVFGDRPRLLTLMPTWLPPLELLFWKAWAPLLTPPFLSYPHQDRQPNGLSIQLLIPPALLSPWCRPQHDTGLPTGLQLQFLPFTESNFNTVGPIGPF